LLGREILLSDYSPKLSLKLPRKQILKAKFPVIDIHFHFNSDFITEEDKRVLAPEALMKSMDSIGVIMIVGNDGPNIEELIKRYHNKFPDKFLNFTNILSGIPQKNTDEFLAKRPAEMERLVKMGLSGIGELPKELGLKMRDDSGKLIPADDPRLDPLYAKAGELGIPIVWHVSDPQPCFEPVDKYNERFIQLGKYPEWSYYGPDFPDKKTLLKQRENVLKKHPNTIFIGAHVGDNADDLNYAAYLFDTYPNYYFEFSSALGDLGRQPYSARKFFIKYQDRILFGTDGGSLFNVAGWSVAKFYRAYFEFLETENEYIDYPLQGAIFQGNWKIFGINLPDEVLEKIYYKNAQKILSKQGINIKVYDK
jgi:predicted TIM-barrel fold metal-dependent hydrolase